MSTSQQRLDAAKLRVLATGQREMAEGYRRQSEHPAYPGQESICLSKARQVEALASQNEAEADLIEDQST